MDYEVRQPDARNASPILEKLYKDLEENNKRFEGSFTANKGKISFYENFLYSHLILETYGEIGREQKRLALLNHEHTDFYPEHQMD